MHITNRYLDLRPIAAEMSRYFGLQCGWIHHESKTGLCRDSDWVLIARNDNILKQPGVAAHLRPIKLADTTPLWTDDYSNVLQILR